MEKIISTLNRTHSYLRKRRKKKRRDKELQEIIRKTRSAPQNNFQFKTEAYYSDRAHLDAVRRFGKTYLNGYNKTDWNMVLNLISGIKSEWFIPESIFASFIEPRLNNAAYLAGYREKNTYDLFFRDIDRPETLLRYVNGDYYDRQYRLIGKGEAARILANNGKHKLLKKALTGQGQGRGIKIVAPGNEREIIGAIAGCNPSRTSYVVEEWIDQHPVLAGLYSGSVNTLKIITLRLNDRIVHLMTRLNIGRKGTLVDKKGYFAGLSDQGAITTVIDTRNYVSCGIHENSGIKFKGLRVPSFHEAVTMCQKAHRRLLHFDMASWDVAIDREGRPLLIEVNTRSQGIGYHQMANGPLFGEHTIELLSQFRT